MRIDITYEFWRNAVLTSYELFQYTNPQGHQVSAECLGGIWGNREQNLFRARSATTTQLIESRNENRVVGPDPFTHLLHSAWAALDVGAANYLGAFHSHPWNDLEIQEHVAAGNTDAILWQASDEDRHSVPHDCIEIILSLRPLTGVDGGLHRWEQRGLLISGRIDIAHVTISGWYMDDSGRFSQVPVTADFLPRVNEQIDEEAGRSKRGRT